MYVPIPTPNLLAISALVFWPVACVFFYRSRPLFQATLWTILFAQLLLPVNTIFKIEMIPQLDKFSIPSLCALIGCMIVTKRFIKLGNNFGLIEVLLLSFLVSPLITSLLNGDPVHVGGTVTPGVGLYDGISASISQFMSLIPFLLGRQFARGAHDLQAVLRALSIAGLAYSLPLLFEIRFSPQLHGWLYGYVPSDFIQQMREGGGFRPMVFMGHGLIASFFCMTTVVASAALWRMRVRLFQFNAGIATGYLGVVLFLCKSGAALVYGLVLVPLVRFTSPRVQARAALCFAVLALLYPVLRMSQLFPTHALVETAQSVDAARANSLEFRFNQEEELINRASERPLFGWGRYSRNRVYKEDWKGEGVDTSVTDGRWIITFGQFGFFGFLAEFGLLAMPVYRAVRAVSTAQSFKEAVSVGALALIIAINMIELLPNSTLNPWSWLLAGSLLGRSEALLSENKFQMLQQKWAMQSGGSQASRLMKS